VAELFTDEFLEPASDALYRLSGVQVDYRTPAGVVTAIQGITVDIAAGGITCLAGPSGSGKSTMLRVLGLIDRPTAGTVRLRGVEVGGLGQRKRRTIRRTDLATVFQAPTDNLLDHLSVGANLKAAAQAAGQPDRTLQVLEQLGLPGTADWRITALSGGQQQRLAFGCGLAKGASVILADEPTSQLDSASADLVLETITELGKSGITIVVASHDDRLMPLCDRVIRLHNGELEQA
jgi:putative ABC transport system ATP-binding protein